MNLVGAVAATIAFVAGRLASNIYLTPFSFHSINERKRKISSNKEDNPRH
jgi:hypothetical protein